MQDRLLFLIGSPRSGSTLLARMLGAHSQVHAPAEPHLLTPLAHLGYFARVDRAPYDPIIAEAAARELVAALPEGEDDYLEALRAYTDGVYRRLLAPSGRGRLLDKTPAYALCLDFIARLYPTAKFVVLTRHPFAIWSSVAESFFDGDHAVAHAHNPILERYVPAIARFLRECPVPICHVRYERVVAEPEKQLRGICEFAGLPFEPGMVNYGERGGGRTPTAAGLGDPIGVQRETRPTTASVERWKADLAGRTGAVDLCLRMLDALTDEDLASWGFERGALQQELASIPSDARPRRRRPLSRHQLERRVLVGLRRNIHHNAFGRLVRRVRRLCDVLLR